MSLSRKSDKLRFTENTVVRLRKGVSNTKGPRRKTFITGFITDVDGGVYLDEPLEGFRAWNTDELEIVGDGSMKNLK